MNREAIAWLEAQLPSIGRYIPDGFFSLKADTVPYCGEVCSPICDSVLPRYSYSQPPPTEEQVDRYFESGVGGCLEDEDE